MVQVIYRVCFDSGKPSMPTVQTRIAPSTIPSEVLGTRKGKTVLKINECWLYSTTAQRGEKKGKNTSQPNQHS